VDRLQHRGSHRFHEFLRAFFENAFPLELTQNSIERQSVTAYWRLVYRSDRAPIWWKAPLRQLTQAGNQSKPSACIKTFIAPSSVRGLAFMPKGYRIAIAHYGGATYGFRTPPRRRIYSNGKARIFP
jgi:hypothetical protein